MSASAGHGCWHWSSSPSPAHSWALSVAATRASDLRSPCPPPPSPRARTRCAPSSPTATRCPAIIVVTRDDGAPLTPADLAAIEKQVARSGVRPTVEAAVSTVPLDAGPVRVRAQRRSQGAAAPAADGLPDDLRAEVTGGPAFGADIANSFSGANITLLAVTAAVVALLLIVTYRSPVLLAGAAGGHRLRRPGRGSGGHRGRRRDRHEPGRVDVRHHQRAGVRGGHQLRLAAHLPISRGAGPQRQSSRRPSTSRCARPGPRSSRATRPWCWRC